MKIQTVLSNAVRADDGAMVLLAVLAKLTCASAALLSLDAVVLRRGAPADLILFVDDGRFRVPD